MATIPMSRRALTAARAWHVVAAVAALEAVAACSLDVGYLQETTGPDGGGLSDATAPRLDAAPDHSTTDLPDATGGGADVTTDPLDAAAEASPPPPPQPDCGAGLPAGNIIQNGGFECGRAPWYSWSGIINTTTALAHTGTTCVVVTDRTQTTPAGATYLGPVQDISAVMVPGHDYGAIAWATVGMPSDGGAPTPQPVDMTLKYECVPEAGVAPAATYYQIGAVAGVVPGTWTQVTGTFTAPACALLAPTVEVYVEGPDPDLDLYVDDVVVE